MKKVSLRVSIVLLEILLAGCASGGPYVPPSVATKESVPEEFQSNLEVKPADAPNAEPSPALSPSPAAETKKSKKKKKKREKAEAKAPTAFVYPSRRRDPMPIWVGEKQVLEVTYLGFPAGDFEAEVLPMQKIGDRLAYHFKSWVKGSAMLNMLYQLNDTIESFWDADGLFSHQFVMIQREKKTNRDVLELYNSRTKKVFFRTIRYHPDGNKTETNETFPIEPFTQDSFSAIYYARTLPLRDGQKYKFPVVSEGKGWDCQLTVVGHEEMDTPLGRVRTIILEPKTYYNGVMRQQNGRNLIWLTDDDRRFVVRIEAKVKIGTVAARLKEVVLGTPPN